MRTRRVGVVIVALFVAGASASAARAEERNFEVPLFTGVDVSSGLSAIVTVGSPQAVTAEAASGAALDRLKVDVENGTLHLAIEGNFVSWLFNFGQNKPIVVHVTGAAPKSITASAGASVDVNGSDTGVLAVAGSSGAAISASFGQADQVSIDASTGAQLKLTGQCNQLIVNSSTGAGVDARGLACAEVNVNASAGGNANVNALNSVNADASVGGSVLIAGHPPKTTSNSSVGGSVSFAP